jgi:hypothetical protein
MGNEWVSGVDPDGRWVHIAIGAVIGGISSYIKGKSAGLNGKELLHNVFTGVLVGGVTAGVGISVSSNTKEIFKNLLPNSINNFSSLASSSISGAFAGFTGSFFGQLLSNNEIDWSAVGQSALYGFGGGLAAGTTDLIPIMSKTFPAHHLAKHILRSTSFQLGGNLISGSKPFENATFGIDETSIIPGLFDVAANTSKVWASKLAENWISKNRKSLLPKGFISNPDKANINSKVNHVDLYSNKGGLSLRLNANLEISGLARFNLGIIKTQYQDMKFNFNFNGSITLFSSHNYNYIYQAYLFNSKIWWRN